MAQAYIELNNPILMKVIAITGTPGTGKTTVAKLLSKKLHFKYIDVNIVIRENKLIAGYDKKRKCRIVDEKKLCSILIKKIKAMRQSKLKGVIIDSHLSHYLPKRHVDLCIIAKCSLKTLEKRLKKRGYAKEKIRENIDSEIFDICRMEAVEKGHTTLIVDTSKGIGNKVIKQIETLLD